MAALRSQGDPEDLDLATQPLRPVVIPVRPEARNTVAGEVLERIKGNGLVPTEGVSVALKNLADSSEFDDKFNTTQSQSAALSQSPAKPGPPRNADSCLDGTPAQNQFNSPDGYDSDEIVLPTPQQKVVRAGEDTPRVLYTPDENPAVPHVTPRDELRALRDSQPIQSEDNTTQLADPSQEVTKGRGGSADIVAAENLNRRKIQFMATMDDDRAWWNDIKDANKHGAAGGSGCTGSGTEKEHGPASPPGPVLKSIPNDEWVTRKPHESPDDGPASAAGGKTEGGPGATVSRSSVKRKLVDQGSAGGAGETSKRKAGPAGGKGAGACPDVVSKEQGGMPDGLGETHPGTRHVEGSGSAVVAKPCAPDGKVGVEIFKKPRAKKRAGGGAAPPPSKRQKETDETKATPDPKAPVVHESAGTEASNAQAGLAPRPAPALAVDETASPRVAPGPSRGVVKPLVLHSQDTNTSGEAATKGVFVSPDAKAARQLRSKPGYAVPPEPAGAIMASQNDASHVPATAHGPAKRSHALSSSSTAGATSALQGQGAYNLRRKSPKKSKQNKADAPAAKPARAAKSKPQTLFSGLKFILSFAQEPEKKRDQLVQSIVAHGGTVVDVDGGKESLQQLKDPNCLFICNRCLRTKKYLIALATQRIPLHYSWLEDCIEALCILPKSKYALGLGVSMFSQRIHTVTQEELEMIRPPFRGVKFHVKFHGKEEAAETQKYKDIIMWAGGVIVSKGKASFILTDAMGQDGDDGRIVNLEWFRQCLIHQKLLKRTAHPSFGYAFSAEPKLEIPSNPAFAFVAGRCFQVGDCVYIKHRKPGTGDSVAWDPIIFITGFNSYSRNPSITGRVFERRNRNCKRDGRHDSSANEYGLSGRTKTYVINDETVITTVAMAWVVKGQLDPPHASRLTSFFCSGEMVRNMLSPWEASPLRPSGDFVYCPKTGDSLFEKDHALFRNDPDRPFIGRIEKIFHNKGEKLVEVKWLYRDIEIHNDNNDCFKAANTDEAEVMVHSSEFTDINPAASILRRAFVLSKKDFSEVIHTAYNRDDAFFVGYSYQRLYDSPSECNESSFKTVDSDFDVTK